MYGCSGYLRAQTNLLFSNYNNLNASYISCEGDLCTDRENSRNVVCGMLSTVVVMAAFAFVSTLIVIFHPRANTDFFKNGYDRIR